MLPSFHLGHPWLAYYALTSQPAWRRRGRCLRSKRDQHAKQIGLDAGLYVLMQRTALVSPWMLLLRTLQGHTHMHTCTHMRVCSTHCLKPASSATLCHTTESMRSHPMPTDLPMPSCEQRNHMPAVHDGMMALLHADFPLQLCACCGRLHLPPLQHRLLLTDMLQDALTQLHGSLLQVRSRTGARPCMCT